MTITTCEKLISNNFRGREFSDYLREFDEWEAKFPGAVRGSIEFQNGSGPHLIVSSLIHGDETGSLPPVLDFFKKLLAREISFRGKMTVTLGNRAAANVGQRFVEQDLNRVFGDDALDSLETRRAQELKRLFASGDLLVDLHQTIQSTDRAFYTFAYGDNSYLWACYLGETKTLVTRRAGVTFAQGMKGVDEYARDKGVPAVVYESSQKGMTEVAYDRNFAVLTRAAVGIQATRETRDVACTRILVKDSPRLELYVRDGGQEFSDPAMQLRAGVANFHFFRKGERVGSGAGGLPLLSPADGYVLFP